MTFVFNPDEHRCTGRISVFNFVRTPHKERFFKKLDMELTRLPIPEVPLLSRTMASHVGSGMDYAMMREVYETNDLSLLDYPWTRSIAGIAIENDGRTCCPIQPFLDTWEDPNKRFLWYGAVVNAFRARSFPYIEERELASGVEAIRLMRKALARFPLKGSVLYPQATFSVYDTVSRMEIHGDVDLVIDDRLIDLKTSKDPVGCADYRQIQVYAEILNALGVPIRHIEFWNPRRGELYRSRWPANESIRLTCADCCKSFWGSLDDDGESDDVICDECLPDFFEVSCES